VGLEETFTFRAFPILEVRFWVILKAADPLDFACDSCGLAEAIVGSCASL
jgi:hypothetical protein